MTLEQIMKALQEIIDKLAGSEDLTEEDIKELEEKANELEEEKKALISKAEKRNATLNKVKKGIIGTVVETVDGESRKAGETMKSSEKEYRSAYLKTLLGRELTAEERTAYTHKTTDNGAPVPTEMLDEIWDLVSQEHSILEDITIYRTGTAIEITKHTAVAKGRAKNVAEGVANDDEENTFATVTLSGKDFSKTIKVSYAMSKMSIDSFEDYLKNEISTQLGEVLAEDVINQIKKDMNTANKIQTAKAGVVEYTDATKLFALLKKAKNKKVYVNETTLYSQLCGMVDTTGRPIYQPTAQDGASGVLLGAQVRIEEALSDGEILVGDSKKVVMNMVQDIMVEDDKDIEAHKYIYSGYARGESALMYDKAFGLLSLKATA